MEDGRIPLPVGSEFTGQYGSKYVITGPPIAYGGSSLLYPARWAPGGFVVEWRPERCVIKECYPHPAASGHVFTRQDGVVSAAPGDLAAEYFLGRQKEAMAWEEENDGMLRAALQNGPEEEPEPITLPVLDRAALCEGFSGDSFLWADYSGVVLERADGAGWFLPELLAEYRSDVGPARMGGLTQMQAALQAVERLLRPLQVLHEMGLLHGDIQPGNLYLGRDGETGGPGRGCLLDTGGLRPVGEDGRTGPIKDRLVFSTPGFTAPEIQWGNDGSLRLTRAADVYSMGRVFLYLLTGRSYFERGYDRVLTEGAALTRLLPMDGLRLGCGGEQLEQVNQILDRALRLDPAERYRDAGDMLAQVEELERALGLRPMEGPHWPEGAVLRRRLREYCREQAAMYEAMGLPGRAARMLDMAGPGQERA